jgi:dTDP-4-dehydrorhamnose reductase
LTKLLGECVLKYSSIQKWLVARINFVARERWPYQKAFADRFGTYLFADDIALAIKKVIEKDIRGLIHICGNQKFSMFEIAKITTPDVEPMYMNEYSGPPLPVDMSLRSERINAFPIRMKL